jgi:hypothetical protein
MFFVGYLLDKFERLPGMAPMNKRAMVPYLVLGLPLFWGR